MIETWTAQQYTDPSFLASMRHNSENIFGLVRVVLADGTIEVSKRQAMLNLFFWPILTAFNIPIRIDHFVKRIPLNKETLIKCLNPYYEEVMAQDHHNAKRLKRVLHEMNENIYQWCFDDLLAYCATIDIDDMSRIMNDPPMRKEIDSKWQIEESWSTKQVEDFIESHRKVIMDMLGTPGALQHQTLLPYQQIGLLNKFQVPQTMYAFGVRTDVNDNIISKPVIGSAIDGLRDIHEFAIESLSAKKSAFYNHNSVSRSQYFGRRQHLLSSSVRHLYKGDCGSTQLVAFNITADDKVHGITSNASNVIGKVILDKETNTYVTLTNKNIDKYKGTTVMMRSPMTCRYRDGVCEVCGGQVLGNINRKILIGIMSAIHTIEPVTQKILSAKHLIKTNSIEYIIPDAAKKLVRQVNTSDMVWTPEFQKIVSQCRIGIPVKCFTRFDDVARIRSDKPITESNYSRIDAFYIERDGKVTEYEMFQDKQTPFLAYDFLLHVRDHLHEKEIKNGIIWLPLKGSEKLQIFKTIVVNDNMNEFVTSVETFLGNPITKCTSCSEALEEFSSIIYSKVSANIVHLEVLLKSYEIGEGDDWRIPRVENADNVRFGSMNDILSNRHVGIRLAYQFVKKYFRSPNTYVTPRQTSPFDMMIGYTDY